jgi:arylsulfatase A
MADLPRTAPSQNGHAPSRPSFPLSLATAMGILGVLEEPFMTHARWAIAAAAGLALGLFTARAADDAKRPNFLVILADDIGWGDYPCYNPQSKVPAPNLDRLCREGLRFTDAHTPAALCAPTRYCMVTGNYTWRGRLPGGTWGFSQPPQFLEGQKTIGHLLQSAGYRTAMFGKTHFGGVFEKNPGGAVDFSKPMKVGYREWGFDYSYGLLGGHQAPPYMYFENNRVVGDPAKVVPLKKGALNGGMIPAEGPGLPDWNSTTVGETLVTKAIGFIDDHLAKNKADGKDRPFFIHFCTDGAHSPYTPPASLLGEPVRDTTKISAHLDMVHETDVILGQFLAALEKRGLLADTLIAFTSDNGGIPADRAAGHDAVGGLRGSKSFIFEGGHRVPFVVRWGDGTPAGSKVMPGRVSRQVIGAHDIVPTMAELAGAKAGPDQMLDSVSLVPVLLGTQPEDKPLRTALLIQSSPGRDAFDETRADVPPKGKKRGPAPTQAEKEQEYSATARKGAGTGSDGMAHALRQGPWKLTFDIQNRAAALYNLDDDLAEQKNLMAEAAQADRVQRMTAIYREIRSSKRSTPAN